MDKKDEKIYVPKPKVSNRNKIQTKEDFAYDFIPNLNEWVNIDEQKKKAKELEDM